MEFDLVVIGGGAAGLAAARTARRRKATVALVSSGPLGGDCTFYGCVPSKTLIESSRQGLGFGAAMARVRSTIGRVAATEDAEVLRSEGVEVFLAPAVVTGRGELNVAGSGLRYRRLVLATGSAPVLPPVHGLGTVGALTNETVFALSDQPASLLVVGGGPIGVELGQAFSAFGTAVTIVEAADRVLPREEPEASQVVARVLGAAGVDVRTGCRLRSVSRRAGAISAQLDDGSELRADQVLVAVGRRPRTADLGLERAGARLDERGFVRTDRHLRAGARGVYAAGDVTGRAMLTHAADEMGRVAAHNALSLVPWRRFDQDAVPGVTYTAPEVARVGMTEQQAAAVRGARVAVVQLDELDRAVTAGRTDGYVKLITAPRPGTGNIAGGRVIGATIVAERAGEMIALVALAMRTGMLPARLALTVQAYPTWALGVRQAAAQFFVEVGGHRARPARATPP